MNNHPAHIEVALFPIPDMVTFPGMRVPLHVFEPRYRAMIKHCQDQQQMLAVCHTKKALSKPTQKKPGHNPLNSNQNSYEPQDIFSAGHVGLTETTEDGRLYVIVDMRVRLKMIQVTQQVPFMIATCEPLVDHNDQDTRAAELKLMTDINQVMLTLSEEHSPELQELLSSDDWVSLTPSEFSYQLFRYIRFEPELMQAVLEQTSVLQRLQIVWAGLGAKA